MPVSPRLLPLISGIVTLLLGLAVAVSLLTGRGLPLGPLNDNSSGAGAGAPPASGQVDQIDGGSAIDADADYGEVPPFRFTGSDGRPVTRDDFDGEVWAVDFIFTRCPAACPVMAQSFARVQSAIQADPLLDGLTLLSISVDAEHDTPDVLDAYAQRYGADPAVWRFATGEPGQAIDFSNQTFGLLAVDNDLSDNPAPGELEFTHSDRVALIDRDGVIRGFFSAQDPAAMQQMQKLAAVLLAREAGPTSDAVGRSASATAPATEAGAP